MCACGWDAGFVMNTDDRDDLVGEVADALTLDQQVQWERCSRLAAGADREQIENLRVIESVLASRPVAGPGSEAAEATRAYGGAVLGRVVQVLIAIASIEVAATLLLLPWAWGDYYREHGELAVFMTTKFVGHAAGAGLLLWAGRRDWRTWLLGVYCLLKASHAPLLMLPAFVLELPPPQEFDAFLQHLPAANRLFVALYVPAFLFAPAFLWAFARECPRVHRRTRLDDLARRMIPTSVLIGGGLWLACAVTLELARAGAAAPVALVLDGTIATLDLLTLGAVIFIALRAHTASADEVRRVVVFSAGFLLLMGLSAAYNVAEVFAPGDWISNYHWSPTILLMEVLRFPGFLLLWYAVLAARIPHLREALRALYRRLLLRRGTARGGGRRARRGAGVAHRAQPGAYGGRRHRGSPGAVAVRGRRNPVAADRRPGTHPDPPGRLDPPRERGPAAGPGRCGGRPGAGRADHHRRRDRHPDGAARLRLAGDPAGCGRRRDPRGWVQRPAGPVRAPVAPDGHCPLVGNRRRACAGRAERAAVGLPLAAAR